MCVSYTSFKALPSNKLTGEATFVIPTVISHMSYHSRFKLELIKMSQNKRQLDRRRAGRRTEVETRYQTKHLSEHRRRVSCGSLPFDRAAPTIRLTTYRLGFIVIRTGVEWSGGWRRRSGNRTTDGARRPTPAPASDSYSRRADCHR